MVLRKHKGIQKTDPLSFYLTLGALLIRAVPFLCIAAIFCLLSCQVSEQRFIASFDGRKVSVEELRSYMKPLIYVLQDRPYYNKYQEAEARRQALEYYVVESILADRARDRGLQESDTFIHLLAQQKKGLARQYLYRTEIVEKSKVSDYEAEQYYRDHKEEFSSPDTVVYRRIFFHVLSDASQAEREKILATAHSVLDQLAEGKEFQKLMEEYSTDPPKYQTARYSVLGDDSISTPEAKLVFELTVNHYSDLIETPLGYGIYQVKARYAEQEIPFQAVRSRILQSLEKAARQNTIRVFTQRAERNFGVVARFRMFPSWPDESETLFQIGSERVSLADLEKEIAGRFPNQEPNWSQVKSFLEALYLSRLLDYAAQDFNLESVRELKRNAFFYENYLLSQLWLDDRVTSHHISREDQLRYYEAHPEYFRTKAKRECRMIRCYAHASPAATLDERMYALKMAEHNIQRAHEELLEGAEFSEVARRYSEDKFARNGGYIGYVTEPSSALFDINVKKLAEGEFSSPIALSNGYMIIKLESFIPRQVKPFEDVQDALLERMRIEYRRALYTSVRKEILDASNLTLLTGED